MVAQWFKVRARVQDGRIDPNHKRYGAKKINFRVTNALVHLRLAREARKTEQVERACRHYEKCIEVWDEANATDSGEWKDEADLARKEYESFCWAVSQAQLVKGG